MIRHLKSNSFIKLPFFSSLLLPLIFPNSPVFDIYCFLSGKGQSDFRKTSIPQAVLKAPVLLLKKGKNKVQVVQSVIWILPTVTQLAFT